MNIFKRYSPWGWSDFDTKNALYTHLELRIKLLESRPSELSYMDNKLFKKAKNNQYAYGLLSPISYCLGIFIARRYGKLKRMHWKSWRFYPGLIITPMIGLEIYTNTITRTILLTPGSQLASEMREIYRERSERVPHIDTDILKEFKRQMPETNSREIRNREKIESIMQRERLEFFFDYGIEALANNYGIEKNDIILSKPLLILCKYAALYIKSNPKNKALLDEIEKLSLHKRELLTFVVLRTADEWSKLIRKLPTEKKDEKEGEKKTL